MPRSKLLTGCLLRLNYLWWRLRWHIYKRTPFFPRKVPASAPPASLAALSMGRALCETQAMGWHQLTFPGLVVSTSIYYYKRCVLCEIHVKMNLCIYLFWKWKVFPGQLTIQKRNSYLYISNHKIRWNVTSVPCERCKWPFMKLLGGVSSSQMTLERRWHLSWVLNNDPARNLSSAPSHLTLLCTNLSPFNCFHFLLPITGGS